MTTGTLKNLERHAADHVLRNLKEKRHAHLRRQCLDHWRGFYGEQFAANVEKLVRSEWKK